MPALIFDCDGVLAETERDGHLPAYNQTFAEFGLPVCWTPETYAGPFQIPGGRERMASLLTEDFVREAGLPADPAAQAALLDRWHRRKTAIYAERVRAGHVIARPGVARLVDEALAAGWRVAVASASAEPAVRAVLLTVLGAERAERIAVFAGDVVARKKPAPDIYLLALEQLGARPSEALVIEDSRPGLLAAVAAGISCVVTPSCYTLGEGFDEAALVVSHLGDPGLPLAVLANRCRATPGEFLTVGDLVLCRLGA
jgi:HAD superfamily hydrolase (TIGR01509 family)